MDLMLNHKMKTISKIIAIAALIVIIYLCARLGGSEKHVETSSLQYVAVDTNTLKPAREIYVPINLESNTPNGYREIRTIIKIRNTSFYDSLYLSALDYYDMDGMLLKRVFDSTVLVKPMATISVIIKNSEFESQGDNFIVRWHSKNPLHQPFIQTVNLDDVNRVISVENGVSTVYKNMGMD